MTFERPELLTLAPLAVLVAALCVHRQWRRGLRLVEAYGTDPARRLAPRDLERFPGTRLIALLGAIVGLAAAAAGPAIPPPEPESARPIDLVVAVDLSLSMTAADVGPSRAARAVEVLERLIDALPDERVGVAIFADWPYTLVPLTHDLDVIRFFSRTLGPDLVSDRDQGSGLGAAVAHARSTLVRRRRPEAEPAILVLSDGEVHDDPGAVLDSVAAATGDGVRLWTGGLGTPGGAALLRPGSLDDPLLDETGAPVVAAMDEALLRRMVSTGGGGYHDVSDDGGLRALLDELAGTGRATATAPTGPGPAFWLALLAMPLLLWEGAGDSQRRRVTRARGGDRP